MNSIAGQPVTGQPLVSVLMTTYNREKYLAMAVDSVLNSTYTHFELIIVDDGSKDQTVSIARAYEQKDPRVKVYINEKNLGDYPNRNKAASYAKGKYLKYVDADDYIYAFGLELMVHYMELPEHANVALGIFGLTQDNSQPYPLLMQPKDTIRRHFIDQVFTLGVAPLSTIIRRDIFEKENGFSNQRMVGDFECWCRLSLKYPVVILPVLGCWYRKHDMQEVKHVDKFLGDYHRIAKHTLKEAFQYGYITREEFNSSVKKTDRKFLKLLGAVFMKTGKPGDVKYLLERSGDGFFNLFKSKF